MTPLDFNKSKALEATHFNLIEQHKPERSEVHGETICPTCKSAAPCDVALTAMKQVQRERDARIKVLKRGLS